MKFNNFKVIVFVLIGVLSLSLSFVYAETAEEALKKSDEYLRNFNSSGALTEVNRAIELNPNYDKAYYNRGIIYNISMNYTQAISDFTKAIEINPNYAEAYYWRGMSYWDKKEEYDKALADMFKAKELGYEISDLIIKNLKRDAGRED